MRMTIRIQMDNAAFDVTCGSEVARILRDVAERVDGYNKVGVERNFTSRRLYDVNGDETGAIKVEAVE